MKMKDTSGQFFAIRLSFAFGIIMLALKWYAYIITGSSAILSDAAESVVHIIGVGFAVFSLWLSLRPADEKHTYGHDKISYFSAGFEGALIVLAAFYILYISSRKLITGVQLTNIDLGTYFILSAALLNLFLGLFLLRKGKTTNSLILSANGKHVLTDSWTSFGIVVGLILTRATGWLPFDPILAILVALNILWSGSKLIRKSAGGLMDEGAESIGNIIRESINEKIRETNLKYHELRYRESGNVVWVEFHLLFPKDALLKDAHHYATEIEKSIKSKLKSNVHITTHLETLEDHQVEHEEVS
ncbi:MAG: cation diffusion facilitator family transporter [Ignavibacteriaceae bacterium]|jgi:cation diffusion facilitator family transporter